MTKETVLKRVIGQALVRGYTTKGNEKKAVDATLIDAQVEQVLITLVDILEKEKIPRFDCGDWKDTNEYENAHQFEVGEIEGNNRLVEKLISKLRITGEV